MIKGTLLALAVTAGLAACAKAPPADDPPPAALSIRGPITPRTVDQLALLFRDERPPTKVVIQLSSGGGDFDTALRLARWIESVPRSTVVVTGACDSACLMIFAAARERLVGPHAEFGAHGPRCNADGLLGLPCRLFWEPWARRELHDYVARASRDWVHYLDAQTPPAFERSGTDFVHVTGADLIAFGAATSLTHSQLRAALEGE
jgi:membrane-bound ClpP family serine protease